MTPKAIKTADATPDIERYAKSRLCRVRELREQLSVGHTTAYSLIKSGEIPHVRVRGAIRIPQQAIDDYILRQLRQSTGE